MHRTQVVQSPNFNDCLKVNIDDHTRPQKKFKFKLQVTAEKFITDLLVTQKMVESRRQEIQIIT